MDTTGPNENINTVTMIKTKPSENESKNINETKRKIIKILDRIDIDERVNAILSMFLSALFSFISFRVIFFGLDTATKMCFKNNPL